MLPSDPLPDAQPTPWRAASSNPVLVVEDNDDDFDMISTTLNEVVSPQRVHRAVNGDACLDLLFSKGRVSDPMLILLDLNTYGTDGREVLARLRGTNRYKSTPVVVLTSSRNGTDIAYCYSHSCNAYHVKPLDGLEFRGLVRDIAVYWFRRTVVPAEAVQLS